MKIISILVSILALSQAALLPIDTSIVDVKSQRSGQDYSYSVHENRGFIFDPTVFAQHPIQGVRTVGPGIGPTHAITPTMTSHQVQFKDHHKQQETEDVDTKSSADSGAEKVATTGGIFASPSFVVPHAYPYVGFPHYPFYPARPLVYV